MTTKGGSHVTLSREAYREHLRAVSAKPKSKYNSKRTMGHDGTRMFDSKAEARRYAELSLLQDRGEISDLVCQPAYELVVNGTKVGTYKADFRYNDKSGRVRVEDVKGGKATQTPLSRFKVKLFEALYAGLKVEIVS